ncbi:A/G-specific adenine glycosylase [Rubritalea tangerina]|uniref:Adenine DNA glycosylase n=1 Tax=Rubritalea tangerina TaxID=430798 RepID=A0ABW4ZDD5_9BACT
MLATDHPEAFQQALITWFQKTAKDYPWRQTSDPWLILVSEIMLQQTQVKTVLDKGFYTNFTTKYPTPQSLAIAPEEEILSAWEGLGYYRRVRNLQKAAQAICEIHSGSFPTSHADILQLPGIGQYTAGAVASFAYNDSQALVDANVARIFARIFDYHQKVDSSKGSKQLWHWASELVSPSNPRAYNSALMELGQQICTNKSPQCTKCPIQQWCTTNTPEQLPKKKERKKTVQIEEHCLLAVHANEILLHQADSSARRSGMWKLPERPLHLLENLPLLSKSTYAITHHKVTLYIYQASQVPSPQKNEAWHDIQQLEALPIPSPFRKVLNTLLEDLFC